MSTLTHVVVIAIVSLGALQAQQLDGRDRYQIQRFDKSFRACEAMRKDPKSFPEAKVRAELRSLKGRLKEISYAGTKSPEYAERAKQYEGFKAMVDAAFGGGEAKAAGLTREDRSMFQSFDANYEAQAPVRRDPKAYARPSVEQIFERLQSYLDRLSDAAKKTEGYTSRAKQLADFRAQCAAAWGDPGAAKPPLSKPESPAEDEAKKPDLTGFKPPRPTAAETDTPLREGDAKHLGAFDTFLAERQAAFDDPQDQDEIDLRCELQGLWTILAEVDPGFLNEETRLPVRERRWTYERLKFALDQTFGEPEEAPWGSRERDRLSSIESELTAPGGRAWFGMHDPLNYQIPEKVEALKTTFADYRKELDDMIKLRRTKHYLGAEVAYRKAQEELRARLEVARDLAAQAGDVDAQLEAYQTIFPQDSFDPSFTGSVGNREAVRAWAKQLGNWSGKRAETLAFFERAAKTSVKARSKSFRRYWGWFEQRVGERIGDARRKAELWKNGRDSAWPMRNTKVSDGQDKAREKRMRYFRESVEKLGAYLVFHEAFHGTSDDSMQADYEVLTAALARMESEAGGIVEARRLKPAGFTDAKKLALAQETAAALYGAENVRGLRLTDPLSTYTYEEIISGGYIRTTWYQRYWAQMAVKKKGKWWITDLPIEQRVDSAGGGIRGWYAGGEGSFTREILEENIDK